MAASKNTQRVAGLLTAMAMIVKPQCDDAAILASPCDASSPANGGWIVSAPAWPLSMVLWYVALPALHSALAATLAEVLSGRCSHQMSFPPVTCHRPAAHPACRSILDLCIFNVRDERSFAGIAPQRPARLCLKIRCNYVCDVPIRATWLVTCHPDTGVSGFISKAF